MKRFLPLLLVSFAWLTLTSQVRAHEFWAIAKPFHSAPKEAVSVSFHVGEQFKGDVVPIARQQAAMLSLFNGADRFDMRQQLPTERALPELQFALPAEGAWLMAFDSHPNAITMQAEKFHAYLHDEGLDAVIKQREAAGKQSEPGRELFRRNVKILLRSGEKSSAAYATRTGQRFEIVPAQDPQAVRPGGRLDLHVYFDGKPLGGVLLKAWHQREHQLLTVRVTTDDSGKTSVNLPYAGTWMLSAVHMIPAAAPAEADWESYWANLSFAMPENLPTAKSSD
jgi:uncharacterized GH25 family protein